MSTTDHASRLRALSDLLYCGFPVMAQHRSVIDDLWDIIVLTREGTQRTDLGRWGTTDASLYLGLLAARRQLPLPMSLVEEQRPKFAANVRKYVAPTEWQSDQAWPLRRNFISIYNLGIVGVRLVVAS